MTDARLIQLREWLPEVLGEPYRALAPASADASFRRYFRVHLDRGSRIVMDAPPDREDCRPFLHAARLLAERGLNVPRVLAADVTRGFLLLEDFGDLSYLDALNGDNAARLYGDAMDALLRLQRGGAPAVFPPYDEALLRGEMALFRDWYLVRHLGLAPEDERLADLEEIFARLAAAALAQPRVWVHRDYHSRNLMVVEGNNPGILDFQDAVVGPVTYDLVSLLRDCYVRWPGHRLDEWLAAYYRRASAAGLLGGAGEGEFRRWFDWMGVQRHLKAVGIFARLWHRDGKRRYLADIPRTLSYLRQVSGAYPELADLKRLLSRLPVPPME